MVTFYSMLSNVGPDIRFFSYANTDILRSSYLKRMSPSCKVPDILYCHKVQMEKVLINLWFCRLLQNRKM